MPSPSKAGACRMFVQGLRKEITVKLSHDTWRQIGKAYNIPTEATVVPLSIAGNRTYQISLPGGIKQVLRLYDSGVQAAQVQSELSVLAYLGRRTELKTPSPIPVHNGQFFTTVDETNKPEPTLVAMFSFVSGKAIKDTISLEMMFRVGQTLGLVDLALAKADLEIKPTLSAIRPRWDSQARIDWALSQMFKHQAEYKFLNDSISSKQLHPTLLTIAKRLQNHFHKLWKHLPHQLLHGDANLSNLVWDDTGIGIFDFTNMRYGPRIDELTAPLHSIYHLDISNNVALSFSLLQLTEKLLEGYRRYIRVSEIELSSFSLMQAIRLFGGLGWEVSRQQASQEKQALEQSGRAKIDQILALLEAYEHNLILRRFRKPKFWVALAAKVRGCQN